MYVEFNLPSIIAIKCIDYDIKQWADQHSIEYYKTKRHKLTYRLILINEQAYAHFALTWNPAWMVSKNFIFRQPK